MKAKSALVVFLLFLFCFSFAKPTFAAVVINEVSPATSPEWVEVYNTSPEAVSLQGYIIDFGSDSQKKSFCDGGEIAGNSYKLINLTASWLNNDGDTVTLKNDSGIVDSISYGAGTSLQKPNNTQSITRSPDGSSNWILTDVLTQQGNLVSFECPTPSPTPTDSPTPTKIPTPTPTSKPTNTPTSTKTPTPTSKPSLTLTPIATSVKTPTDSVLGEATKSALPTKEEEKDSVKTESLSSKPDNLIGKIFIFLGIIFLLACAIVIAYPLIVRFKREKLDG